MANPCGSSKADAMGDVNDHFHSVFAHLALRIPVTVAISDATIDVNDDFHSVFVHLALRILVTVAKSDVVIDVNEDFHSAFVHVALRIPSIVANSKWPNAKTYYESNDFMYICLEAFLIEY
jgi:hypothetical protein